MVSKTPSETNGHYTKITAHIPRTAKSSFPVACFSNLNEAESNALCNTNSGWKKGFTDCGKVQLKKQTLQAPGEQESKQRFLNTELNFKSSLYLISHYHCLLSKIESSMSWSIQNKPQQAQLCLHRQPGQKGHTGKWKKQPAGFLRDYTASAFILLPSYSGAKKATGRSLLCSEKTSVFSPQAWSSLRAATPSTAQYFLCEL